jgi:uncharacterized membrane protein
MSPYARSLLAGSSTGGRTFTALAGLALTATAPDGRQPDQSLAHPWVKTVITLAAAQELVMDKLPQTPSRLQPAGLILRGVAAAAAGVIIARRATPQRPVAQLHVVDRVDSADWVDRIDGVGEPPAASTLTAAVCAGLAVVAAVGASFGGARWRGWAAPRLGGDLAAALIEDSLVIALAASALS